MGESALGALARGGLGRTDCAFRFAAKVMDKERA